MCFAASDVVYGRVMPALPLLFSAHAFVATQPARDFLALLLLRRSRQTLSTGTLSRPPSPTATIIDLPTELIHLIEAELVEGAAADAQRSWDATFLASHNAAAHDRFPLDEEASRHAEVALRSAAFQTMDLEPPTENTAPPWWNECFWCEKMRFDALWELASGESSFLLEELQSYLARYSLKVASPRPLELASSVGTQEASLVICDADAQLGIAAHPCAACGFTAPTPGRASSPAGPSSDVQNLPSPPLFTQEQILAADLDDCSIDEDEGCVAYVEEVAPAEVASAHEVRRLEHAFGRLGQDLTHCGWDESASDRSLRWLRVVEVDCACN